MYTLLIKLLINALSVFISAKLLDGIQVKGFGHALGVAIIIALVNTFIKPVLVFLSIPLNILTFGLFIFVINAVLILLVSAMVPSFRVKNFTWALLFSILLSIINSLLYNFLI